VGVVSLLPFGSAGKAGGFLLPAACCVQTTTTTFSMPTTNLIFFEQIIHGKSRQINANNHNIFMDMIHEKSQDHNYLT